MKLSELVRTLAEHLATFAEGLAALLVGLALVHACVRAVVGALRHGPSAFDDVRMSVGRSLVLALEFLLAADILRTAVNPSWDELSKLAVVATIRTALNFFLERELHADERARREASRRSSPATPPRRATDDRPIPQ